MLSTQAARPSGQRLFNVAIVGATGAVGVELMECLERRNFPVRSLKLLASPRFQRVANGGGRAQRLLWASTGTKDPKASDDLYIKALAAPFTVKMAVRPSAMRTRMTSP